MFSRSPRTRALGTAPRRLSAVTAVALSLTLALAGCDMAPRDEVFHRLNGDRDLRNVRLLTRDRTYGTKAQNHAARMASNRRLSHSSLSLGPGICAMGENVGVATSVEGVQHAFMRSSGHRRNVLNSRYDHVGVGVTRAGGQYWVVQIFVDRC